MGRPHKYLHHDPVNTAREASYRCVNGIVWDELSEQIGNTRHANEVTRFETAQQRKMRKLAEDAEWAARSGPVFIVRPAKAVG